MPERTKMTTTPTPKIITSAPKPITFNLIGWIEKILNGDARDITEKDFSNAREELADLRAENEKLREALQFYADGKTWGEWKNNDAGWRTFHQSDLIIEDERGNRARTALGEKREAE